MACLFVDQLTVLDVACLDGGRGLVGESWIVDLELEGELDEQSMVLDFGQVKRAIKRAIDDSVDHTLVIPRDAPELQIERDGERHRLLFHSAVGAIEHVAPGCAVTELPGREVSPQAVAERLQQHIRPTLPASVHDLRLRLRPEAIDGACYHYSHGLKKHAGACQRIAHGHRSKIEVWIDGSRAERIEKDIALRWTDIYLGSREDLVARANGRMRFAYDAPEGRFELALPEQCVDLLDSDSTVECIAAHLYRELHDRHLDEGESLRLRAYEGVNKGAIAAGPRDGA